MDAFARTASHGALRLMGALPILFVMVFWVRKPAGIMPLTIWVCSILSVLAAGFSFLARPPFRSARSVSSHVALYAGVAATLMLIVLIAMRSIYEGIDLFHGYPWHGIRNYGFGPWGLWPLLALVCACGLGYLATREPKLLTVNFWLVFLLTAWACLLSDPFQPTITGAYERTDATLILVECVSGLVLVCAVLAGWWSQWQPKPVRPLPPGFRTSVAVVALALNLGVLYHILVPAGHSSSFLRLSSFRAGLAAATAGLGCLYVLRRSWGSHLADAGLGLFGLSLAGLATIIVPHDEGALARRYPMIFNAMLAGYALAAAIFTHLVHVWGRSDRPPDALSTRLVPHLTRFAFLSGATALLAGVMMCFWPGVPSICAPDNTLDRVLAGVGAYLFLLLVTLRAGRLMEKYTFHLLTTAVAVCMVSFLITRALPFASGAY